MLAFQILFPCPSWYSGATLTWFSAESDMISDKRLGSWWYKGASLCPEGSLDLCAPRGYLRYLKTRDLSQLSGFARDLTAGLEWAGLLCSDGHRWAMTSCSLKLGGRIWFARRVLSFREWEGYRVGWIGIRHTVEDWKFLCIMTWAYLFCFWGRKLILRKKN